LALIKYWALPRAKGEILIASANDANRIAECGWINAPVAAVHCGEQQSQSSLNGSTLTDPVGRTLNV
jgi:hypothetical protein